MVTELICKVDARIIKTLRRLILYSRKVSNFRNTSNVFIDLKIPLYGALEAFFSFMLHGDNDSTTRTLARESRHNIFCIKYEVDSYKHGKDAQFWVVSDIFYVNVIQIKLVHSFKAVK
jgi:hypothetical protein